MLIIDPIGWINHARGATFLATLIVRSEEAYMSSRRIALAAAVALASTTFARAETLKPIQGRAFDLGDVSGVVYYTAAPDGLHVVATLAQRDDNPVPLRMEAVLAPGQSMVISTPRAVGSLPEAVVISRVADTVQVRSSVKTVTN
jgi:hypothetical protein